MKINISGIDNIRNKIIVYRVGKGELFSGFCIDKNIGLNFSNSYKTYFDFMGGQIYEQLSSALTIGFGGNLSIVTSTMFSNLYIKSDVLSFDVNMMINEYIAGGNVLSYLNDRVFTNILPRAYGKMPDCFTSISNFLRKNIEEGKMTLGENDLLVLLNEGIAQAFDRSFKDARFLQSPIMGSGWKNKMIKISVCDLLVFNDVVLDKVSIKFPLWFRTLKDVNYVELSLSFKSNEIIYTKGEISGNMDYQDGKMVFGGV